MFSATGEGSSVTPDEQLSHLETELDRLRSEHPSVYGILRLTDACLRPCSKWKWERHGWKLSDGESCAIMNGNDRERRAALLSVLKNRMIHQVEIVPDLGVLEVVPDL